MLLIGFYESTSLDLKGHHPALYMWLLNLSDLLPLTSVLCYCNKQLG